jgi:hypothetical protein
MSSNWVFNSIFGELPVATPTVPPCPIIDDPQPLSTTQRSPETDRLIRQLETESAIEAICGSEVSAMVKNSAWQPASPRAQSAPSTLTYESIFPDLPAPVSDPRLPQCDCGCQMCRTGGCKNCLANPRCELSALAGPLSDILPVDEKTGAELHQAALSRQQERLGKSRLAKHKHALAPLVAKFKSDLRPYSARVPDKLFERVLDSAASYVGDSVSAR